jgi:hypothetical protein
LCDYYLVSYFEQTGKLGEATAHARSALAALRSCQKTETQRAAELRKQLDQRFVTNTGRFLGSAISAGIVAGLTGGLVNPIPNPRLVSKEELTSRVEEADALAGIYGRLADKLARRPQ